MKFTLISRRRLVRWALCPLGSLLSPAVLARTAPALQLARIAPAEIDPRGYLVSEKLDGVRAFWDGSELRFRGGNTVVAPKWFTCKLPQVPLDGELWMGRGRFDALSGVVRRHAAVEVDWRRVRYEVFDLPAAPGPFAERAERLRDVVRDAGFAALSAVPQRTCPDRASLVQFYEQVLRGGGEGLMLHRADAPWRSGRSEALLKLKPVSDAEAQVVAHQPGRGKHAGRLGALQVRTPAGVEFLLGTGFSDAERERPPAIGTWVTYTHRGLTSDGVPRFASFLRLRGAE